MADRRLSPTGNASLSRRLSPAPARSGRSRPTASAHMEQPPVSKSKSFEEEVKEEFARLDVNGNGTLEFSELEGLLRSGRPELTNHEVKLVYDRVDKDQNGRVDFNEFVDYVFSEGSRATGPGSEGPEKLPRAAATHRGAAVAKARGAFVTPAGRSKAKSKAAAGTGRRSPSPARARGPLADAVALLFDALDSNGSGTLSPEDIALAQDLLDSVVKSSASPARPPRRVNAAEFERWALGLLTSSADAPEDLPAAVVGRARAVKPPFEPWSGTDADRAHISPILENALFLTGWRGAYDLEKMRGVGATHVASIGSEFEGELPCADLGCKYFCVEITDDEEQADKMQEVLGKAVAFLHSAMRGGGRIVVHCAAGISRSTTVVLAYLVAHRGLTLRAAFELAKRARPMVWPNLGFMRVLIRWEEQHRKGKASMRLRQYELWTSYDEEEYSLAKVVDRG